MFISRHLRAKYSNFKVGSANDLYRLNIGPLISRNLTDSLFYHNGQFFSTVDRDNDVDDDANCADKSKV